MGGIDPNGLEAKVMHLKARMRSGDRKAVIQSTLELFGLVPTDEFLHHVQLVRAMIPDFNQEWVNEAMAIILREAEQVQGLE